VVGDILLDAVVRLDGLIQPDTDTYGHAVIGAGGLATNIAARRAAAPWSTTKTEPSFEDMLAKLRRTIIAAVHRAWGLSSRVARKSRFPSCPPQPGTGHPTMARPSRTSGRQMQHQRGLNHGAVGGSGVDELFRRTVRQADTAREQQARR
jgi:hypothetical protein